MKKTPGIKCAGSLRVVVRMIARLWLTSKKHQFETT